MTGLHWRSAVRAEVSTLTYLGTGSRPNGTAGQLFLQKNTVNVILLAEFYILSMHETMRSPLLPLLAFLALPSAILASPGLTIYNQNFAVVRDTVPLNLTNGINDVKFDGATIHLEPDSVILRDPDGTPLQILEQNYRNDPVTQQLLLSLFEGKEIEFAVHEPNKPDHVVKGTVIRSGYVPHNGMAMQRYGQGYAMSQMYMAGDAGAGQPIIEVDGKIQFSLPGEPIFPSLGDDTILKPQLDWKISVPKDLKTDAELGYITEGMSWEASYNMVAPETGDTLDLVGWITMDNQSGRNFEDAHIKLMAGDVNKIAPQSMVQYGMAMGMAKTADAEDGPPVTEKAFDEYHLYTLERPTTLRDRETKQVEFVHATGIKSEVIYVYDGADIDWNQWRGYNPDFRRENQEFGTQSNTKVAVMREFKNTKENGLGIPLPKGLIRFYRSNGSQLEFIGENTIDHTPTDELIRMNTGNAFDLVGERKRVGFTVDNANRRLAESFEIKVRNRKKDPVTIRVVEHLYRGDNWQIVAKSDEFTSLDSNQIEFQIPLKPNEEHTLTYTILYTW